MSGPETFSGSWMPHLRGCDQREVDLQHLAKSLTMAKRSPDPNTKVGAVLTRGSLSVCSAFNTFPDGIATTPERLADREVKNSLMVHAEQAVICKAASWGIKTSACTLYIVATDDTGAVWGGPPCASRCLPIVLAAGISEIVSWPFKSGPSKWGAEIARARELIAEAGIVYREVQP